MIDTAYQPVTVIYHLKRIDYHENTKGYEHLRSSTKFLCIEFLFHIQILTSPGRKKEHSHLSLTLPGELGNER